jgi:glyoxylase-like metal-dependent hydrolase (beta-lactamase superfamily II)
MAKRQEQEDARDEVREVAPNVLRMELPIRIPGLGHVNCYGLVDDQGVALVDPGLPGPLSWRALQDRLRRAGLAVRHVHTVIVTHSHPDHFGGATRLVREAGAKVVAHHAFSFGMFGGGGPKGVHVEASAEDLAAQREVERELRQQESAEATGRDTAAQTTAEEWKRIWAGRTPWGGRSSRRRTLMYLAWRAVRWVSGSPLVPRITAPVEHGQVLRLAGREWFMLHTPGHTPDHVCLHDPAEGLLLAGDHVLPSITPHISGVSPNPDPLQAFFYSLDRVGEIQGVRTVLPAHGHPFSDLRARTLAIKAHHMDRLQRIREIGRELGAATVEDFSKRLFRPTAWGSMAESETFAHLEHMRIGREADRYEDEEGRFVYLIR